MTETTSCLPFATEGEDFAFHHSSPHSLRQSFSSPPAPPLLEHISDADNYDAANDIIDDALADDDLTQLSEEDRRISGHSSISSFPASVIQRPPEQNPATPTRPSHPHTYRNGSTGSFAEHSLSPRLGRGFGSAFRNPSSVKAMQMRDDDTESITLYHKRSGSRTSVRSHGSVHLTHTSPSKRQSRSNQSSPLKGSSLKKEFPLVLLHCTLLPPAGSTMPVNCDNELYAALLPEEYQKRWNSLQDRLADPEMRARGVLIPHPQEDYHLLEERLLETLELENPRIRGNHFFQHEKSGGDSGFESASQTEDESGDDTAKDGRCPDCGKCLHLKLEGDRKWEIKIYAANGLMRAGAWGAAWREMEKVDIEISLAMPDDVRREVNARLDALKAAQEASELPADDPPPAMDTREQEIYGSRPANSGHVLAQHSITQVPPKPPRQHTQSGASVDLLRDRKNIIIALLSILVLFYAMTGAAMQPTDLPEASAIATSTSVEAQTSTVTSTSVFTSVTTAENPVLSISATSLEEVPSQASNTSQQTGYETASDFEPAEGPAENDPVRDEEETANMNEVVEE